VKAFEWHKWNFTERWLLAIVIDLPWIIKKGGLVITTEEGKSVTLRYIVKIDKLLPNSPQPSSLEI
jgi:hypothetical protein